MNFCIYSESHRSVRIGAGKWKDTASSPPRSSMHYEKVNRKNHEGKDTMDFHTKNMKSFLNLF